jgi:hypothetical protein
MARDSDKASQPILLALCIGRSTDSRPALVVLLTSAGPKPQVHPMSGGIEKPLATFAL